MSPLYENSKETEVLILKKKAAAVIMAAFLLFIPSGCSGSGKNKNNESTGTGQSTDTQAAQDGTQAENTNDISSISQDEIASTEDNEFYAANASSADITNLYVAVSGSGDWGGNLLSSPLAKNTKIKLSLGELKEGESYDICTVDADGTTVEYYSFDMKTTVQVTFYDNAECDVTTI